MSTTVLRLGLWMMILVLGLYVWSETFPEHAFAELITAPLLQQALALSVVTIVVGLILRILGFGADAISRNRCRICRTVIPSGAIYCREHLRSILHEEDDRTHSTKIRRR